MAVPLRRLDGEAGPDLVFLAATTLAVYTAAGTTAPVVGDLVIMDTGGDWYVARASDNTEKRMGEVIKIELAPTGSALGYLVVRWLDAIRIVALTTDDAATCTLLNSCKKDGDTSVADNVDAATNTTGTLILASKGGLSTNGAGEVYAIVFGN